MRETNKQFHARQRHGPRTSRRERELAELLVHGAIERAKVISAVEEKFRDIGEKQAEANGETTRHLKREGEAKRGEIHRRRDDTDRHVTKELIQAFRTPNHRPREAPNARRNDALERGVTRLGGAHSLTVPLGASPIHPRPIDALHVLLDAVRLAKIVHGAATVLYRAVIVHDQISSDRKLRVQGLQRGVRGFVHIAVQT
jgi:hypothetical protein